MLTTNSFRKDGTYVYYQDGGHTLPAQTLDYIGITGEEVEDAYRKLNLGSKKYNYLIDSDIEEYDELAI